MKFLTLDWIYHANRIMAVWYVNAHACGEQTIQQCEGNIQILSSKNGCSDIPLGGRRNTLPGQVHYRTLILILYSFCIFISSLSLSLSLSLTHTHTHTHTHTANRINLITNNLRLGFGSFSDKVTRPYTQ